MNRLLLSSLLATGLAFGASGVFAADQYGNSDHENQQAESYRQNTENNSPESGEYTVQSGDTLSSIAETELGSSDRWQEIAQANNIDNPDRIYVGQTLTIPSGENKNGSSANSRESSSFGTTGQERASAENMPRQKDVYDKDMGSKSDEAMNDGQKDWESKSQNDQSMDQTHKELKGEITEIGDDSDSFSLKDAQGMTHTYSKLEDEDLLQKVSVGDFVKIEIENGTVVSLEKVDRNA